MFLLFKFDVISQCGMSDSIENGAAKEYDIFYSLANKQVAKVPSNNWHLAFSMQSGNYITNPALGVAVRVNSANTGVRLRKLKGVNPSNWRSIDSSGFYAAADLYDSDSTWNLSAFTSGYSMKKDAYDFIWGRYNQNIHSVQGNSVFVLYNTADGWYKKMTIVKCEFDTVWNFIISNLDNSDSVNVSLYRRNYPNKLFAYYNVVTKQILDREPPKANWDLLWTVYQTNIANTRYSVFGAYSNPDIFVERNMGLKCNAVNLNNRTSKVNPSISAIGYDWKVFSMANLRYDIVDTFVYFIKSQTNVMYKLSFNSYNGNPINKTIFNLQTASSNLAKIDHVSLCKIYPNPAHELLQIKTDLNVLEIKIYDLQGQLISAANGDRAIDISSFANGLYLVQIQTEAGVFYEKLVKE